MACGLEIEHSIHDMIPNRFARWNVYMVTFDMAAGAQQNKHYQVLLIIC